MLQDREPRPFFSQDYGMDFTDGAGMTGTYRQEKPWQRVGNDGRFGHCEPFDMCLLDPMTFSSRPADTTTNGYLEEPFCGRLDDFDVQMFPQGALDPGELSPPESSWEYPSLTSSPSESGFESTYIGSGAGDGRFTRVSSPGPTSGARSLQSPVFERISYMCEPTPLQPTDSTDHRSCVTMQDVQKWADVACTDRISFDDGPANYGCVYGTFAQEGYQPIPGGAGASGPIGPTNPPGSDVTGQDPEYRSPPAARRGRAQSDHVLASCAAPSRVTKSSSGKRRTTARSDSNSAEPSHAHTFPCPLVIYGCDSMFRSKNEWKRHVNTQHIRLGFWRCDQCDGNRFNDFNRKDLFCQHVRRMHAHCLPVASDDEEKSSGSKAEATRSSSQSDEDVLTTMAQRCYHSTRSPPDESGCHFCSTKFHTDTWDQRMEHIGRHMENSKKPDARESADPAHWQPDKAFESWLFREGLIVRNGKRFVLAKTQN